MKAYTYSEARRRFARVLDIAKNEEVLIKRRNGDVFSIVCKEVASSPLDVKGITTKATTDDIIEAVRQTRNR
jgi:hypothetical protein